jgi:hypothetical protein
METSQGVKPSIVLAFLLFILPMRNEIKSSAIDFLYRRFFYSIYKNLKQSLEFFPYITFEKLKEIILSQRNVQNFLKENQKYLF